MSESVFVEWSDKYDTGIEFVDRQHRRLVEIINNLHKGLCDRSLDRADVFRKAALEAMEYAKNHFSQEEEWMRGIHYPKIKYQQEEHAKFIRQLISDAENFSDSNPRAAFHYVNFLRDWLISHIAIEDKEFSFYMRTISAKGNQ